MKAMSQLSKNGVRIPIGNTFVENKYFNMIYLVIQLVW